MAEGVGFVPKLTIFCGDFGWFGPLFKHISHYFGKLRAVFGQ
jgi:hypothetical protein